ncbi:MAG: hypothetical protein ACI4AK_04790 [Lepagella sp.]
MRETITAIIAIMAILPMSGQNELKRASAGIGRIDKLEESRRLVNEAKQDSACPDLLRAYYVAGKLEISAFEVRETKRKINPGDKLADVEEMNRELSEGYDNYLRALQLDTTLDVKGRAKVKYSKEIAKSLNQHHGDYYRYGVEMYNKRKYYPEAYRSFMIYGEMPGQSWATKSVKDTPDSLIAKSYYYAGIGAYSAGEMEASAKALGKAREHGISEERSYIFEIAAWKNIMMRDAGKEASAKNAIEVSAAEAYRRFGTKNPLYISSLISTMVDNGKIAGALEIADREIGLDPENSHLYALRAWIHERDYEPDKALADYCKAADLKGANAETLTKAAKKLYERGRELWNRLEGVEAEKRKEIKEKYYLVAKGYAERAKELSPNDSDTELVLMSINYDLAL